ncbi:MAG: sulfatase [Fuerstiella sp.]|nr:sulfatase [Fuerstiella sp.]
MKRLPPVLILVIVAAPHAFAADRPNIFIAISDDVSFPHASAHGSKMVNTPAFDRVAADGVLFNNAFCPAPGCSPSRAAFLTGRHIWMIEEAGTHASYFQAKYKTFPEALQASGYFVGATGKAWAPGNFRHNGREHNPAGKLYGAKKSGYVGGFEKFMSERPQDQPFCFWFGSSDAHRSYKKGSGLAKGKTLDQAEVPAFLPDHPEIRSDLLDYAFEVERFDDDCDQMLKILEAAGELDNTLVIITSDNGMPFPRAKANCYEYGIHMPLAVCWRDRVPGGRKLNDLVGFVDLTATIYEAAGVDVPDDFPVVGKSLVADLTSNKSGMADPTRDAVYVGRERHSSSRFNSLGYPQRAIRTQDYLYIYNFKAERWPAGTPHKFGRAVYSAEGSLLSSQTGAEHGGYHDIDACPSLTFLIENRNHADFGAYLGWSVDKRPAEELFDIKVDAACLNNLADDPKMVAVKQELNQRLMKELTKTNDARVLVGGDVWETYPRISSLRWFAAPEWAKQNPAAVPQQEWLDVLRPKK